MRVSVGSAFCELPVEDDWTTAAGTERHRPGLYTQSAKSFTARASVFSQCTASSVTNSTIVAGGMLSM